MSFENLLIDISKGFCNAQEDRIVNAVALTSTNLQSSKFLYNFYFDDCLSEENLYEAEEKEISNILY